MDLTVKGKKGRIKVAFIANTSWYLYNFRLPLITEFLSRDLEVVVIAPKDKWSEILKQLGIRFINVGINRKGQNIVEDIKLTNTLIKIYRKEHPDYIFHFTIKPVVFGTIASIFINNIKVINNITGLGYVFIGSSIKHQILQPIVRLLYRFSLRYSYRLVFQNGDDKNYFLKYGLFNDDNKMIIVPGSGIVISNSKDIREKKDNNICKFIFVGRMLKDKGVIEYFLAAKEIKKRYNNVEFIIIGDFDLNNPEFISTAEVEKWCQNGIVKYCGWIEDVESQLKDSDVFVLPSYREGMPRSTLEALAASLPIITTNVPGCRETVVHGKNGLLVPMKNVHKLVEAIEYMLNNPEERLWMGKESRKLAVERFDVKRVNRIFLDAMGIK